MHSSQPVFAPHKKHFRSIICGGLTHEGIGSSLILCGSKVSLESFSLVMTLSSIVRFCRIRPKYLTRGDLFATMITGTSKRDQNLNPIGGKFFFQQTI
ncbi:MAG: hypothetical protein WAK17_24620 [Candidatus Nitrosopolaris sp.]